RVRDADHRVADLLRCLGVVFVDGKGNRLHVVVEVARRVLADDERVNASRLQRALGELRFDQIAVGGDGDEAARHSVAESIRPQLRQTISPVKGMATMAMSEKTASGGSATPNISKMNQMPN